MLLRYHQKERRLLQTAGRRLGIARCSVVSIRRAHFLLLQISPRPRKRARSQDLRQFFGWLQSQSAYWVYVMHLYHYINFIVKQWDPQGLPGLRRLSKMLGEVNEIKPPKPNLQYILMLVVLAAKAPRAGLRGPSGPLFKK